MEKKWILVCDEYKGLQGKAVNVISRTFDSLMNEVLPVLEFSEANEDELKANNLIIVGEGKNTGLVGKLVAEGKIGVATEEQSYTVSVRESEFNTRNQCVIVAGSDERGVLYGAEDFCNRYCGSLIFKNGLYDMMFTDYFKKPFDFRLPEWNISETPVLKERGIWSWGHVIYDYKAFFENMARLRLNEAVIWNDYVPINANSVVEYAHSLGIKVIWGFPWGWDTDCNTATALDEDSLIKLKQSIIEKYEKEYLGTKGDGIYFQSFTELSTEYIGDKLIAETVVNFVNDVAGELLSKYPDLQLQFGLHSDSVKNRLGIISKVNPKVSIIWENCGGFPYDGYWSDLNADNETGNFSEAVELTEKTAVLRGEKDKYGVVIKAMTSLDWKRFVHQRGRYVLGEYDRDFIENRSREKDKIWKQRQALWIKHAEKAKKIISLMSEKNKNANVMGLVEDGMLEFKISLPAAIFAELVWNPLRNTEDVIYDAMRYHCVKTANN